MSTTTTMNPSLAEERKRCSFSPDKMAVLIYGGEKRLEQRRRIAALVQSEPELQDSYDVNFMSREELYENAMRKTVAMMKHAGRLNISDPEEASLYRSLVMGRCTSPMDLHYVMFIPTLQGQATEEQQEKWLMPALRTEIIGTYAQTEMGHGTDVRRLETTATYDPVREQFDLHMPTLTATKWWPGNLGKSSNHAVVLAQLWTKGKCHGIHSFVVQLRDLKTHLPLPGVTIGDIGPKMGLNSNDNGFLQFDHVRVPRMNMLMRFSQILQDGTYVPPKQEKLGYGSMMFVRSVMIRDLAARGLASACTIAIRYSCVRRQGEINPGSGEVKVLDYKTQQYKLFPHLSAAYAFYFAGQFVLQQYFSIMADLNSGNVADLPGLHAVSSGLKAFVSYETLRGIETCRFACGGHGFSMSSGLPELYNYFSPACTYEGENTVMLLQVARFLVKQFRQREKVVLAKYLDIDFGLSSSLNQDTKIDDLINIYYHTAQRLVRGCVRQLDQLVARGYTAEEAWNLAGVQLNRASKAHVNAFIVQNFADSCRTATSQGTDYQTVLVQLCELYALWGIERSAGKHMEDGYVNAQQIQYVRENLDVLLGRIRPNAVGLVDSWLFSDLSLRSVLGRYDGNVYENLLAWAKSSPFNKQEVMTCHQKYLGDRNTMDADVSDGFLRAKL